MKNSGRSAAVSTGWTSRKYACETEAIRLSPRVNANRSTTRGTISSSSAPNWAWSATATGTSTTSMASIGTSCTVTTEVGTASLGKRTFDTSEDWSTSELAALRSDWEKNSHTTS